MIDGENPYLLLTPGPLSTTRSVKEVMLKDWCTWDDDYNRIVQEVRHRLRELSGGTEEEYTSVLMQGSGTFSVESVLTTAIPADGKLLVAANGAYGQRMGKIAAQAGIKVAVLDLGELSPALPENIEKELQADSQITHVAVVHCETTTGMLNPVEDIGQVVKRFGKVYIVDAMSSFGGIPMDINTIGADFIISSANKCIQGVPGFGFIIAARNQMEQLEGRARSLSLDLYSQWKVMEEKNGKWRFTSPTHVVRSFNRALEELQLEGGVQKRFERYCENHQVLVKGMSALGFRSILKEDWQSPIITAFYNPEHPDYDFGLFYAALKERGFVIYPGKVTELDTFRIGNIGDVQPRDMNRLVEAVEESIYWRNEE
jgi:2-aminoethylphosphonate-pyruvate transaminase